MTKASKRSFYKKENKGTFPIINYEVKRLKQESREIRERKKILRKLEEQRIKILLDK